MSFGDQSGDVWPQNISAHTPHNNFQAQWWRGDDLGLFAAIRPGHLVVNESREVVRQKCSIWIGFEEAGFRQILEKPFSVVLWLVSYCL